MSGKWSWRAFAAATIAAAVGLAAAAGAGATPPTKGEVEVIPYEFSVDCSPYGFAFELDVQGQELVWVETFYDEAGNPVKFVVHDSFTETDTNSVTGKVLPFSSRIVETFRCRHTHRRRQDVSDDGPRPRSSHSRRRPRRLRRPVPRLVRGRTP